jgi:hypothetical protein
MRPKVTNNTIVYIRFRKDLDAIIEQVAFDYNIGKATLVRKAITEYMTEVLPSYYIDGKIINSDMYPNSLFDLSKSFFSKKGRASSKNIGKPMRVTLNKVDETNIRLLAQQLGYTVPQMRTAIVVCWLELNGKLG